MDKPFKDVEVQSPDPRGSKMSEGSAKPGANAEKDSNGGIAIQTSSKTLKEQLAKSALSETNPNPSSAFKKKRHSELPPRPAAGKVNAS